MSSYEKIRNQNVLKNNKLNIYSVVEAVNSAIEPGEEKLVPIIVKQIIESGKARFVH